MKTETTRTVWMTKAEVREVLLAHVRATLGDTEYQTPTDDARVFVSEDQSARVTW